MSAKFTQEDVDRINAKRGATVPTHVKPSKYRNVKTVVDGIVFDSKREANYWHELKLLEKARDITALQRQVSFPLLAPDLTNGTENPSGLYSQVALYVSDFTFMDAEGVRHVVDAKGKRTAMYILKAKWMRLQYGIEIEEV